MRHPDYPLWSFIGLLLVLLPAAWHFRARNTATICLIGWQAAASLTLFVNSLLWSDSYADISPGWCDVGSRILLAVGYAIPACSLCQMHRLESVASTRRSSITARDRTRRIWAEVTLCVFFPLLMLPIHYLVQGHRYDILENIGCYISFYRSWPAILVRYVVPMAMSIGALVYAGLAVRWFLVRRLQFRTILASSHSGLTIDRYLRLVALAVIDVSILAIIDILALITTFHGSGDFNKAEVSADIRWSSIHFNYAQISQIPEEINSPASYVAQVLAFYMTPLYSIIFFIFFGFGEEAINEYVLLARSVKRVLGLGGHTSKSMIPEVSLGSKVITSTAPDTDEAIDIGIPMSADLNVLGARGIPVTIERCVV